MATLLSTGKKKRYAQGVNDMRMLDLFSGIGGFSLAASWVWGDELEIAGFCEIDEYCGKVLNKNFPGVPVYKDITKLDGKQFKNIDLLTGGFPCQDISVAGRGAGIEDGTRSGLWSEMLRVISEVRPGYALIENVPMLTIRGGTRVIADLTQIGYDASWTIVSAQDVGAWHRRKRIWIVAYPNRDRTKWNESENGTGRRPEQSGENVPDTESKRLKPFKNRTAIIRSQERSELLCRSGDTERIRPNGKYWAVEPNVGRVANGVPNRVDRLKGLGNAIVPQCVALIMERIKNK